MRYREFVSALLHTPEVRALGNTFLYGTSYDLFNEYLSESSTAAIYGRRIGLDFAGQSEVQLYILLDFLTFIPFGNVGREYLKAKGVCIEESAYLYASLLLEAAGVTPTETEMASLRRFFTVRSDATVSLDAVGVASAARQIGDRLFNGILLGECAGSLGKAKKLAFYLKRLAEEYPASGEESPILQPVLSSLPELSALSEGQIAHLEASADTIK